MYKINNTRFNFAWISVILMLGVAILLGFFGLSVLSCIAVFLLGVGLVCITLGYFMSKRLPAMIGFGIFFVIVGVVMLVSTYAATSLPLIIAGVVIALALSGLAFLIIELKVKRKNR